MVAISNIRFALGISVVLYIVLLFAEYLRPGFVSSAMNVHGIWLVIVPLCIVECMSRNFVPPRSKLVLVLSILAGIIFGLIVWKLGEPFDAARFWFAAAVGALPIVPLRFNR
ncbi:MAG: hypothetical protein WCT28_03095 [Patescibacteria group bacterium]|jgi:hypothetical protein